MSNTDSTPFMDLVPSISLRENERGMQIGAGWNPHYHEPIDLYSSYSDKDFRRSQRPDDPGRCGAIGWNHVEEVN
jgi:hypothetical protein